MGAIKMSKFKIVESKLNPNEEKLIGPIQMSGYEELVADRFGNQSHVNIDDIVRYIIDRIRHNYHIDISSIVINAIKNKLAMLLGADEEGFVSKISVKTNSKKKIYSQADPLAAMMGAPAMPPAPGGMPPAPGGAPEETIITGPIKSIAELIADSDVVNTIKSNPQMSPEEIAMQVWTEYGGTEDGRVDQGKVGERVDSDSQRDIEKIKKEKEMQDESDTKYKRLLKGKTLLDIDITLDDLTKSITSMPFSIVQKVKGQGGAPGGAPGGMPGLMGESSKLMKKTSKFHQAKLQKNSYWA